MKTKHTPGNWYIHQPDYEHINIVTDEQFICEIPAPIEINEDTAERKQTAEANAKLIAAAPELLQMVFDLKNCIAKLCHDRVSQFDRDHEANWIGEAHELLSKINPDYYQNANTKNQ
jgi:hypothetical protein